MSQIHFCVCSLLILFQVAFFALDCHFYVLKYNVSFCDFFLCFIFRDTCASTDRVNDPIISYLVIFFLYICYSLIHPNCVSQIIYIYVFLSEQDLTTWLMDSFFPCKNKDCPTRCT